MQTPLPGHRALEHWLGGNIGEQFERVLAKPWLPPVVNTAAVLLLAASFATWTWRLATPAAPTVSAPAAAAPGAAPFAYNLQAILAAQLFGLAPATGANIENIPLSSLNLALTGLVTADEESLALIRVEGQPEAPFAIGQEVTAGAVLQSVHSDRAIILRNGVAESLLLEGAAQALPGTSGQDPSGPAARGQRSGDLGIRSQGPNSYVVSREALESQMRNPQQMLTQSLMVPHAGGGFLVREIKPGSVYEKLGLKVGDVVRSANGQPLNTLEDVMKVYQQSTNNNYVSLEILRNGRLETLQYSLQ